MKRGGKRDGAGRKALPIGETKRAVTLFIKDKIIAQFGGQKTLKETIYKIIGRDDS